MAAETVDVYGRPMMARDLESVFQTWAKPPGLAEQDKCGNAERAIRGAKTASEALSRRQVSVSLKGSYRNRTNVRQDSDVDISLLCTESLFYQLPEGMTPADVNISVPAKYPFAEFKNDVAVALVSRFGRSTVERGSKAFRVHENSYRVDADVVPCFEHRWYRRDKTYVTGAAFLAKTGGRIVNWPDQNYANGVAKNEATGRRFKGVVRILKRLRNEMAEAGYRVAEPVPSYLLECLAWCVPDEDFGHATCVEDVRLVINYLRENTNDDEACGAWREINGCKPLFGSSQSWTREQVHAFVSGVGDYAGLG